MRTASYPFGRAMLHDILMGLLISLGFDRVSQGLRLVGTIGVLLLRTPQQLHPVQALNPARDVQCSTRW